MKYLRKFNENVGDDCDFETFKEIMYELSDDYQQHSFTDYSQEEDPYYELHIELSCNGNYMIQDDVPYLNFEFINLSELDDPTSILKDFNIKEFYSEINSHNDSLLELKNRIDTVIENNKQITDIFKKIEIIIPRFEAFSNFRDIYVGFDKYNGDIKISFEMDSKSDNTKNRSGVDSLEDEYLEDDTSEQYPF